MNMKRLNMWWVISLFLCIFGFLKEIRPSEPFIYEFLIGEWRNITPEQVTQEVYPVGTYSYLAHLIVIFLITDLCRYKPLIVVLALSGIVVWCMLLWTTSLLALQILEVFYGTFMATEVAYYSYIYAKVKDEYYFKVTAHTRAAILAGRFLSGVLAQTLVSFSIMDYRELNYITLGAMVAAALWALLLPPVDTSIYFFKEKSKVNCKDAFTLMKTHFVESFSKMYVFKWSMWWALATSGFIQVQNYMQPLWSVIRGEENSTLYNGLVEALLTLLGCIGAMTMGYINVDWKNKGELILSVCAITSSSLILASSQAAYVVISYVCYILFGGIYHCMITVASAEVAKKIPKDSYGLVFGINTFVALLLSTLLTMCLVTGNLGWALAPRDQHLAYGLYHLGITALFIIIGSINWYKNRGDVMKTY